MTKRITADHVKLKRSLRTRRILIDRPMAARRQKQMLRSINGSRISRRARLAKMVRSRLCRGAEFRCRYAAEIHQHPEQLSGLRALARQGAITLVFSAHDEVHNERLRYGICFGTRDEAKGRDDSSIASWRKSDAMTDSVKIELVPHDPIASTLSAADDRLVMSEWLPPQEGSFPASASEGAGSASCGCYRSEPRRSFSRLPSHRACESFKACTPLSRSTPVSHSPRPRSIRLSVVVTAAALPEHALHDVHHSRRNPDPGRSPAALLDAGLHARHGVVRFSIQSLRAGFGPQRTIR